MGMQGTWRVELLERADAPWPSPGKNLYLRCYEPNPATDTLTLVRRGFSW